MGRYNRERIRRIRYLTEDGKIHDDYRIDYLRNYIATMEKAIEYGVEMIVFCPWSAVDLLSTSNGIKKRYGFIYVDRTDDDPKRCERIRKDSFYWYKKSDRFKWRGFELAENSSNRTSF